MAKSKLNLRDSQLQARLGLIASVASLVLVLLLAYIVIENFNPQEKTIAYSGRTLRYPAILAMTGLSGMLGAIGFGLGFSSLGHRRNARQRESWAGFLLGALVICADVVVFVFFKMFSLSIIV